MVESGTVDLQERIQVQAPSTDLAFMIKRLKLGDNSVLTKKQPLYGDFTQLPSSGTELVNTLLHAEYTFNQLPVEDRKKHGYDYRSWLASILAIWFGIASIYVLSNLLIPLYSNIQSTNG